MNIKRGMLMIFILVFAVVVTGCGEDITGSGTEEEPFVIHTLEGLEMIGNEEGYSLDDYYKLGEDIDASSTQDDSYNQGQGWESIGDDDNRFTGNIDGDGYQIAGLYINRPNDSYQALVNYNEGSINDLKLTDVEIEGNNDIGGLVARNFGRIEGVYVSGEIRGNNRVGGIVGRNVEEIENSYADTNIEGNDYLGELVGRDYGIIYMSSPSGEPTVTGTGEEEDPYVLYSFIDLEMLSLGYLPSDAYYQLDGDIDAISTEDRDYNDGQGWQAIGEYSFDNDGVISGGFEGVFDGEGNEISNLYIDRPDSKFENDNAVGLFAAVNGGKIKNTALVNVNIEGNEGIGGLAAINYEGRIEKSSVEGSIEGVDLVGGLVGFNIDGEVVNSYADGSIEGYEGIGGLVAYNGGIIKGSHSQGDIIGSEYVGGLVSENIGEINNSYTIADVFGDSHKGDLAGINTGTIYKSSTRGEPTVSGSGAESDPYVLHSFIDLEMLSLGYLPLDANYELSDDIDASITQDEDYNSGQGWIPIGVNYKARNNSFEGGFEGNFDGGGNKISNLYINDLNSSVEDGAIGLFSLLNKGEIKNIDLVNLKIKGNEAVGGLLGFNIGGRIINSSVKGNIEGEESVGGLVGFNSGLNIDGEIVSSYSKANVKGDEFIAGLVGFNINGRILNSYAEGNVQGELGIAGLVAYNEGRIENTYVKSSVEAKEIAGGLVAYSNEQIENSYAKGSVKADENVGGLLALNEGVVESSYSSSSVEGVEQIGGLVAYNNVLVNNSYWDVESSNLDSSDGGRAKTTADMQKKATYDAFDFDDIWAIDEDNSYPYFQWE